MTIEGERIAVELREVFEGNPWHGSSMKEILSGVTHAMAIRKPVSSAHTIWELVRHVSVWMDIGYRRLHGEAVEATPDEDWPPVKETTMDDWERDLKQLESNERQLEESVSRLTAEELDKNVPGRDHDARFMLHGIIYHIIYHSGQIALLKKAMG